MVHVRQALHPDVLVVVYADDLWGISHMPRCPAGSDTVRMLTSAGFPGRPVDCITACQLLACEGKHEDKVACEGKYLSYFL